MVEAMRAWKDFHNRAAKRLENRLQPAVPRNVVPLRFIGGYEHPPWSGPNPPRLVAEMKDIINHRDFGTVSAGWDAALRQADPRFLWETLILDRNAKYASLWTDGERTIVADAIAATYERFASADSWFGEQPTDVR
jgi:hypothetical protein